VKNFTTILAIYVFALIIVPCEDSEYHHDSTSTDIAYVFDGSHSELCSPFCSDHECHTHITVTFVNSTFVAEQFVKAANVEIATNIPTPFFAIWQPPKIG